MLKEQATDLLSNREQIRRTSLVTALQDDPAISSCLPENLLTASLSNPLGWTPHIVPVPSLSDEALRNRVQPYSVAFAAIDSFLSTACRGVRFPCLVGDQEVERRTFLN